MHFANRPESALGLARRGGRFADAEQLIAPKEELDKYADSPRLVVITKANHRSPAGDDSPVYAMPSPAL